MKKHFYVLLCMIVGVVLLMIIQRALLAVYIITVDSYPAYDLFTQAQLALLNWGTIALAAGIGLVYGNYLGHHWYPLVYGEKGKRNNRQPTTSDSSSPQQKTVTVKPVRVARNKVSLKSEIKNHGWDFDDLINHDFPAVESLGSSAPAVASAVSLGETPAAKPKRIVVRKSKPAAKTKVAKKSVTKSITKTKPAAKSSAKSATKVRVKS
jgi:hypothetical protein